MISLRTLRKCISSLDPRRPEDSVISVVEALHNHACRVCDHNAGEKNKVNDNIEGQKKGVSNRADGLNTDSGGNVERIMKQIQVEVTIMDMGRKCPMPIQRISLG